VSTKNPETALPDSDATTSRPVSLDTYRGLVMLLMASEGLRLGEVAQHYPHSRVWQFLARQSDHVRGWTFAFVVVGMNSLVMYLLAAFGTRRIQPCLNSFAEMIGISSPVLPIVEALMTLFLFWLVCFWMYRRRLLVRI
jgi:predicted acyltransferase